MRSNNFHDGMRRFLRRPAAVLGASVLTLLIVVVFVIPALSPYGFGDMIKGGARNLSPFTYSAAEQARISAGESVFPHIFGTDSQGRDYFTRVAYGTRISLLVGLFSGIIVTVAGTFYGTVSGYSGGRVDMVMMRIVDVIYSIPDLLIIILLSLAFDAVLPAGDVHSLMGSGVIGIFISLGLVYWAGVARVVRVRVMSVKLSGYCLSARAMGAGNFYVIFRHILPNCAATIIITSAAQIPLAIFTESFLSFVGLGVQAPVPSLGSLAAASMGSIQSAPYKLLFPAAAICLIVFSFNMIAEGLKAAFDTKAG